MHESEKWKWSRSVVPDPQWPHGLQPTRLLHPWDFPGKSAGVGCHCLLQTQLLSHSEANWMRQIESHKVKSFYAKSRSVSEGFEDFDPTDSATISVAWARLSVNHEVLEKMRCLDKKNSKSPPGFNFLLHLLEPSIIVYSFQAGFFSWYPTCLLVPDSHIYQIPQTNSRLY